MPIHKMEYTKIKEITNAEGLSSSELKAFSKLWISKKEQLKGSDEYNESGR